ncbi:MAG: SulP family inorganic anion transporter, partial [Candidatus Promineifilaceae bacterium]|nr:SulP family inorganic anion transporter [Candidatus Promineifilaceae bacterium]
FLVTGIGLALISTTVALVLIALFSSTSGMIGGSQNAPAAVMGVVAAAIAASLAATGASEEQLLATILVAIAIATLVTGAVMYFLGRLRLGGLVHFLPFPVIGGFLAGTGWLLITGGLGLMTGSAVNLGELGTLLQSDHLALTLPGLMLATVFLLATSRAEHALITPSLMLFALLLFYSVVWVVDVPLETLRTEGWLLGPFPERDILPPLALQQLDSKVNWAILARQLPNIAALAFLSVVALLLNISSLEVVAQRDIDLNRECRAAGVGNLAGGLLGGLVSYQMLSLTTLSLRQGRGGRLIGVTAAAVTLFVLLGGASLLALFPKFIAGGLLLYLGLLFLKEWIYDGWRRLSRATTLLCSGSSGSLLPLASWLASPLA